MAEIGPSSGALHIYRLQWWAQLWYLAWGAFSGGVGVILVAAELASGDWKSLLDWRVSLVCVFSLALGCYFFALALRSRVVLAGPRISVRGPVREKSADIREILGYRVTAGRNATFWHIELRNGEYLSIMRNFKVDGTFHDFLTQLRRLGSEDVSSPPVLN